MTIWNAAGERIDGDILDTQLKYAGIAVSSMDNVTLNCPGHALIAALLELKLKDGGKNVNYHTFSR